MRPPAWYSPEKKEEARAWHEPLHCCILSLCLSHNRCVAVGTDGDNLDGCLQGLLEVVDVCLEGGGEIFLLAQVAQRCLPSWEFLIDGLPSFGVVGHFGGRHAVFGVGGADLDGVEAVEHIALHHDEVRDAVYHNGVLEGHEVNPTAAAVAARDGTKFVANAANLLARLVEEFHGEGARANARAVCLEDAEDVADGVGRHAETRADASARGRGGGDEGVRAVVDVEQRALCAFGQNGLALAQIAVDFVLRVAQLEFLHILDALHPLALLVCDVVVRKVEVAQDLLVAGLEGCVLGVEIVENIAHAQADACCLVAIRRADALARSANLGLSLGGLVGAVEHAVGGQDEVGAAADVQAVGELVARSLQFARFGHEEVGRNDAAVADNIDFAFVEDTRGNRTEHKFLALKDNGVASVGAAGEACHYVVSGREEIHYFTLAFVAEDDTEECINFSLCHFFLSIKNF